MSKKVRICFIAPKAYQLFFKEKEKIPVGGAELQLYLQAIELAKDKNYEISFIVGDYHQDNVKNKYNITIYKGIDPLTNTSIFFKLKNAYTLFILLRKAKSDVYYFSTANVFIYLLYLYCKIFNSKYIYRTAHEKDVDGSWIKNNGINGKLFKVGLENADNIITQTENHRKLLKINNNKNAVVINNFLEIKKTQEVEKNIILWVARFEKWKRPEVFIDIASKFKNEFFVMICPYPSSLRKEWNKLKEKTEKLDNLKMIERVPHKEIQNYFNKAKLFVNTSEFEGFPNTFLQAAQGKTPIVSLKVDPDDFIKKANCGFVCNDNANELVFNVRTILEHTKESSIMGKNGLKYIENNNNISKSILKIKNIINKTLRK